jgi:hypothetical protein
MMLTYNTQVASRPPASEQDMQRARAAMLAPSPYTAAYGRNHADVTRALGDANYSGYRRAADRANADYGAAFTEARGQTVLSGLQQMAKQQQQRQQLGTERMNLVMGGMNSILGGLFR